jgi:hypothetical protein
VPPAGRHAYGYTRVSLTTLGVQVERRLFGPFLGCAPQQVTEAPRPCASDVGANEQILRCLLYDCYYFTIFHYWPSDTLRKYRKYRNTALSCLDLHPIAGDTQDPHCGTTVVPQRPPRRGVAVAQRFRCGEDADAARPASGLDGTVARVTTAGGARRRRIGKSWMGNASTL